MGRPKKEEVKNVVIYTGGAKALPVYDEDGEQVFLKPVPAVRDGMTMNDASGKTIYEPAKPKMQAGTICYGIEFPTNKEVTVEDPAILAKLKANAETEGSNFTIK